MDGMDGDAVADLGCGGCADGILRPRRLDAQGHLPVYLLSLKALCETVKNLPYPDDLDMIAELEKTSGPVLTDARFSQGAC